MEHEIRFVSFWITVYEWKSWMEGSVTSDIKEHKSLFTYISLQDLEICVLIFVLINWEEFAKDKNTNSKFNMSGNNYSESYFEELILLP